MDLNSPPFGVIGSLLLIVVPLLILFLYVLAVCLVCPSELSTTTDNTIDVYISKQMLPKDEESYKGRKEHIAILVRSKGLREVIDVETLPPVPKGS